MEHILPWSARSTPRRQYSRSRTIWPPSFRTCCPASKLEHGKFMSESDRPLFFLGCRRNANHASLAFGAQLYSCTSFARTPILLNLQIGAHKVLSSMRKYIPNEAPTQVHSSKVWRSLNRVYFILSTASTSLSLTSCRQGVAAHNIDSLIKTVARTEAARLANCTVPAMLAEWTRAFSTLEWMRVHSTSCTVRCHGAVGTRS